MLLLLFSNTIIAQNKEIEVTGTLIEGDTSQPLPYATIVSYSKDKKEIISGTTSDNNGKFKLTNSDTNFYLKISTMGFETKTITDFSLKNRKIALGTIVLSSDSKTLDEIVVRGDVSKTVFKLDKRVFNVGKDISSTGASALEALNSVPSVNVNIEGDISLRGSTGVQILINGKPSVLADESSNALGTITADMIESIEVITNPSAKYEASGTGGILNIILKKENKKGWNGSISVNTGMPENHSLGVSLNRRTEKFNLFTQVGAGYRSMPQDTESTNYNKGNNELLESKGIEYRNETFFNFTLGTDYHINELNMLTLSGNYAYEIEAQPSETTYNFYDANKDLISNWKREESTDATNPKYQYELNYSKQFKNKKEHTLLFSALGSSFGKDLNSEFTNTTISGDDNDEIQKVKTDYKRNNYTFKADYTNPISDTYKLETGVQYVINDVGNDYKVETLDKNDNFVIDEDLTNNFEYFQKVMGVYATGSYEGTYWGIKAGLRAEQTNLNTLLTNTNDKNEQNFTNLFPSLHSSYKFSEKFSLQAGYSKRIFRPGLWDLNPFFNIRNNFNVRVGNPNLQPEFTDSYEITGIYAIGTATLSSSLYYKNTTDVIERIYTFEDNITVSKPENIGTRGSVGFETNGKYSPSKWLSFTGDFYFNYFDRDGIYEAQSFDFSGKQWSTRLGSKIGLPADFDIELTGNYRSSYKTIQGSSTGFAFLDVGVRKKIFKGKAIVNLSVRDLFESRIYESTVTEATFETYSLRQRGRFITLGVSYGFGKGEAMTYSGGRRR